MPSPRYATPRRLAAFVVALTLAAACDGTPTAPRKVSPDTPRPVIVDGGHGGLASFYFLPPMVPAPAYTGTFDGTKAPTVRVCELAGSVCGRTVATFGGAEVKVDATAEAYVAVWKTADAGLDPTKQYRVEVLVGPQVLGYLDVMVASSGKELKLVDRTEYAAVIDGGALPIRFRLEAGTTPPPTPPPGPWVGDQYLTYTQAEYGDPQGNGGTFLMARYDAVYSAPSALLTVGSPYPTLHALVFTSASAVLDFLPQSDPILGALGARLVDPTTSRAGVLGGEAVALYLNIQFSDAGQMPSPNGIRFGELRLCGFAAPSPWNGLTVREFQTTIRDALLNGWAPHLPISDVAQMAAQLNGAFAGGAPSAFAQEHLVSGSCPGAWQSGDVRSYSQWSWGSIGSPQATLLINDFFLTYQISGVVMVGLPDPGFSIYFTTAEYVIDYLPDCGVSFSLTRIYIDPSSTESGCLGGGTLALQLDVDFSDAGRLTGSSGIRFGDLRVCGAGGPAAIQGETIRALLARANQMLGGGIPDYGGPYDANDLYILLDDVAQGFEDGMPSFWARMHLVNGSCP